MTIRDSTSDEEKEADKTKYMFAKKEAKKAVD